MPVELERLLEDAAARPGVPVDAEAIVERGLQRRRRRTMVNGGIGFATVVLAALIGVQLVSGTRVDLVGPGPGPSWPLAVRYESLVDERGNGPLRRAAEFAGNSWDDWVHVTGPDGEGIARLQRWGPQRRQGFADLPGAASDQPFALLAAADRATLTAEREPLDADSGMAPHPLFHPRFGIAPEPRADRTILDDDLADLRTEIAERLSLDPSVLAGVRSEHDACAADCGQQIHTYVWLPALQLPLYVEELDPDGSSYEMRVTHLREGVAPPPNPLPLPPPEPPDGPGDPGTVAGLDYRPDGLEFHIKTGTDFIVRIGNEGDKAAETPSTFAVQRWDGRRWVRVALVSVQGPREVAPGRARTVHIPLPDDVSPAWHRVLVSEDGFPRVDLGHFHYAGDPNRSDR